MKIGPIDIKAVPQPATTERPGAKPGAAGAEPSARVELSSRAAPDSDEQRADFDSRKVEAIALAIREGRFQVNAEAIADRLIANARELLPKN